MKSIYHTPHKDIIELNRFKDLYVDDITLNELLFFIIKKITLSLKECVL